VIDKGGAGPLLCGGMVGESLLDRDHT